MRLQTTRRLSLIIFAALLLATLASCGGDTIKSDVPVSEIASRVDSVISSGGNMAEADGSYVSGYVGIGADMYSEGTVMVRSMGVNVDEYGIFRCADDKQAEELLTAVKAYLKMRDDSWMPEYMPEERPKVQSAEYKVLGNYVMYAILSEDDKKAAFPAFEECLKEK